MRLFDVIYFCYNKKERFTKQSKEQQNNNNNKQTNKKQTKQHSNNTPPPKQNNNKNTNKTKNLIICFQINGFSFNGFSFNDQTNNQLNHPTNKQTPSLETILPKRETSNVVLAFDLFTWSYRSDHGLYQLDLVAEGHAVRVLRQTLVDALVCSLRLRNDDGPFACSLYNAVIAVRGGGDHLSVARPCLSARMGETQCDVKGRMDRCIFRPFCLSACLSLCLSVYLSVCLFHPPPPTLCLPTTIYASARRCTYTCAYVCINGWLDR